MQWPPEASDIEAQIDRIKRRRSWHWHEHYNAACAYALPLLDQSLKDVDTLASRAVDHLKSATARADSDYVASRRDWVLSEDPDLKGLRGGREFEEFQILHLPSDRPVPCRPRNVQQLESSRYVRDLLAASAERWWQAWRAYDTRAPTARDTAMVREWFDEEQRAWNNVREVALNFRHPRTRFELIDALRAGAARHNFARPAVPFPRYDEEPLLNLTSCEADYEAEIVGADKRLSKLAVLVGEVVDDLAEWQMTLRSLEADGRPMLRDATARRCVHHTALWQLLGHWLQTRDEGESSRAEAEFRARVERVPPDVATRNGAARAKGAAVLGPTPAQHAVTRGAPGGQELL